MYTIERGPARPAGLALLLAALVATPASAQGQTTGLQLSGNEPIQIESDRLEVREKDHIAVFTGNVSVVQGKTLLKSGKMTVYYTQNGGSATTGSANIERLEVNDKVYMKSETQEATGDRGTFDMASEVLVLTGDRVVLTDGPNVLVGCKLTYQMKSGQAHLEGCQGKNASNGRIKMLLQPQSQQR